VRPTTITGQGAAYQTIGDPPRSLRAIELRTRWNDRFGSKAEELRMSTIGLLCSQKRTSGHEKPLQPSQHKKFARGHTREVVVVLDGLDC
jgi:hypothetical protein